MSEPEAGTIYEHLGTNNLELTYFDYIYKAKHVFGFGVQIGNSKVTRIISGLHAENTKTAGPVEQFLQGRKQL